MEKRKIELHYSFELAINLFRTIEDMISQDEANMLDCTLFAMNRWGGGIVVYYGTIEEFDISTNHPGTEELWEQRRDFGDDDASQADHQNAAAFIIQWLFDR